MGKKFAAIDISLNRDQQGWLDIPLDNLRVGEAMKVASTF